MLTHATLKNALFKGRYYPISAGGEPDALAPVTQLVSDTPTQAGCGGDASPYHTRPPLKGLKLRNDIKTGCLFLKESLWLLNGVWAGGREQENQRGGPFRSLGER